MKEYICRIATLEDIINIYDYKIEHEPEDKENLLVWKENAIAREKSNSSRTYIGVLDGEIISKCIAGFNGEYIQNSDGLINKDTAYLFAFKTKDEYQGQGYFSKLFKFMIEDLKSLGYKKVTLGVEPDDFKNKEIYKKYGFTEYIKTSNEVNPDNTTMLVEYYGKDI